MNTPRIPLRPDYASARRPDSISPVVKLAVSHLMAHAEQGFVDQVIAREYGSDTAVRDFQTRSASTISSQSSVTNFSMTGNIEYVGGLGASSAGLSLLASEGALQFEIGNRAAVNIAGFTAAAGGAGFTQEAAAIAVHQYEISNAVLTPKKFAAISVFSHEVLQRSRPDIEQVVRSAMQNDLGLAFDLASLDANAGTAIRPPGLRYNISANATGASTASSLQEAMNSDLQTVIGSVSAVANNGPIIIIAAPRQAVALRLRQRTNFQYKILSTSGLADGVVMAIASNCLISAIDPTPRFETSDTATFHMDTAATQITTTASTVAYPTVSLFQTDQIALRYIFEVAYALRSATGLSWLGSVKW
jgi:Phage capsid family